MFCVYIIYIFYIQGETSQNADFGNGCVVDRKMCGRNAEPEEMRERNCKPEEICERNVGPE